MYIKYNGIKGVIQSEVEKLLKSNLSDKDLLFKLAGLYGLIISKKEVKAIYK
jgi:hypothetical protein